MNQGLKEYTKQLSYEVGEVANCYVNVKKGAENLHIVIPLVETVGPAAISVGLVYSYQDRTKNYGFGNGMRLTYQNELVIKTNSIEVIEPDGSTDVYEYVTAKGKYINKETGNQIVEQDNTYELSDLQGNKLVYAKNQLSYPSKLVLVDGKEIFYEEYYLRNTFGVQVNFNKISSLTQVRYFLNNKEMIRIDFEYTSGNLSTVKWYRNTTLIRALKITYNKTSILVSDEIKKESVTFSITNGQVVSCQRSYDTEVDSYSKVEISYEYYKAKITQNNETRAIYFDKNESFFFEADSKGNLVKTEWDTTLKKPTFTSNVLSCKNEIYPIDPSSFSVVEGQISVEPSNRTDPDINSFLWDLYRFMGTGKLRYTLTTSACEIDDVISIVTWGVQLCSGKVKVSVFGDISQRETEFHKTEADGNYEPIILGAKVTKNTPSITIELTLTNADIVLSEFDIYKQNAGTYYTYDEQGKLIYTESGINGIERSYNDDGTLAGQEAVRAYRYEYNDKKYLIKSISNYGVETNNTYTENGTMIHQVQVISNKTSATSRVFETRQTPSTDEHNIASITDENNDITYFSYDAFKRLSTIKDALGNTTRYDYFDTDELKKIVVENEEIVSYTYDAKHNLASVTIGETVYSFTYNIKNNITGIKLNNQLLYKYEYDTKDRIIKQYSGSTNKASTFEYNDKDLITKITFDNQTTEFTYDNQDRLTRVKMGNYEKNYTYDAKGNVIKAKDNGIEIDYQYSSQNEINHSLKKISNKEFHEYYFSLNKSKQTHPTSVALGSHPNYVAGIFRESTILKNREYSIPSFKIDGVEHSTKYDGVLPCAYVSDIFPLVYGLSMPSYGKPCGCIGYWFKPTSLTSKKYLFSVQSDNKTSRIDVYINTNKQVVLEITELNGVTQTLLTTTNLVKLNDWNFFGLSFYNRSDEGSTGISEYLLVLNHKKYIYKKNGSCFNVEVGSKPNYYVGCRIYGAQTSLGLDCNITALMIGTRKHITIEQMEDYYRVTKDFVKNTVLLNDSQEADFSLTTTFPLGTIRDQFDIFPLETNGDSLNGTKPSVFEGRTASLAGASTTFTFDRKSKRYAFEADGTRLEYQFQASSSRTILCRACIDEDEDKSTILDCKDIKGNRITLYRKSNTKLYVSINTIEKETSLYMSSNSYHTVGISYQEAGSGDSAASASINVRVYLDGYNYVVSGGLHSTLGTLTVSIGKMFTLGLTYTLGVLAETYPLYGHIELLATRAAYCDLSTLNELSNYMKVPTRVKSFDDMGLLRSIEQKNGETTLLKSAQTYRTRAYTDKDSIKSLHYTKQVAKEQITYANNTANRSYEYYANGNIKTITDTTFGSHSYEYNERGFLTKDDSTDYLYDKNGNITDIGSSHFTYDSTIKDRLVSVNGMAIKYEDSNNPLNPTSYGANKYSYTGKRLTEYKYGDEKTVHIDYNEQGLLAKKTLTLMVDNDGYMEEEVYTYTYGYDGDRLIYENGKNGEFHFLYDETGLLYSFIRNNETYYYVRDILQNIIGIIDKNGKLVVKYDYTAYGQLKSISGDNITLAHANPFRYKGYYYDSETGLYLVTTRYYNPEWCRFISPDSIEYLDPNNINGMNLYAYCRNNPINYVDPDGHMPWWAALLIGGSIIVGLAVASVFTAGTVGTIVSGALAGSIINGALGFASGTTLDENGWSFDWDKAATGFMCGTITGAISGAVSAGISNGFSFAGHAFEKGSYVIRGIKAGVDGLLAMGSYITQSAISGNGISAIGVLISLGTGLLNFADPMGKIFDAIWVPTIGAEIAWGYDMISSAFKRRNQKLLAVY